MEIRYTTVTKSFVKDKFFTDSNENLSEMQKMIGLVRTSMRNVEKQYAFNYIIHQDILWDVSVTSYKVEACGQVKDLHFFGAMARYANPRNEMRVAGATGKTPEDAIFKAVVEAYERYRSNLEDVDFYGTINDLENAYSPYQLMPLTNKQRRFHLKKFSNRKRINWKKGFSIEAGAGIYIPSDVIYYDHKENGYRGRVVCHSTSSGVAAFTNFAEARKHALVELIERDAIMQNWFAQTPARKISNIKIPDEIMKKINIWKELGREVYLLELPSDYGRVIEVCIVSDECPCFICGAAATIDYDENSTNNTIEKAFEEAEYSLLTALIAQTYYDFSKKNVFSPSTHGSYYYIPEHAKELTWLYSGETYDEFERKEAQTTEQLLKETGSVTVDLSERSNNSNNVPIHVVRVLSPQLVPISFGYGMTPYTHKSIKHFDSRSLELPHYFA